MSVNFYLRSLKRQWHTAAIVVALCATLAAVIGLLLPTTYTANVTIYISAQDVSSSNSAYQGTLLSQQRVLSYTDLVTSPRVMGAVIQQLGLPLTSTELADKVAASSSQDSVLIQVSATDVSPERAAAIVNGVARNFDELVQELERPTAPRAIPPVAARTVEPAVPPASPSSVGPITIIAAGLLVGLALGAGAAATRESLDRRLRSGADLEELTGAPSLGRTHRVGVGSARDVGSSVEADRLHQENLRSLRTNLRFVDVDRPPVLIGVTSSVPGEGKSTIAKGLTGVFAAAGERVLLVDADLRRPQIADSCKLDNAVGLTSVLSGRCSLQDATQACQNFAVVTSGPVPPNPSELLGSGHMAKLLQLARDQYDYVIVDCPPVMPVTDTAALAPSLDGVLFLTRYAYARDSDVLTSVRNLQNVSARVLGTVFTMMPSIKQGGSYYGAYVSPTGLEVGEAPPGPPPTINGTHGHRREAQLRRRGPAAADEPDSTTTKFYR